MAKDMKESRSSRKGCLTPPEHEEVMSRKGFDGLELDGAHFLFKMCSPMAVVSNLTRASLKDQMRLDSS